MVRQIGLVPNVDFPNRVPPPPKDQTVVELVEDFRRRADFGFRKYGETTAERSDIDLRGWLQHALEESMDHCVYLKAAIARHDKQPGLVEAERRRLATLDRCKVLHQHVLSIPTSIGLGESCKLDEMLTYIRSIEILAGESSQDQETKH